MNQKVRYLEYVRCDYIPNQPTAISVLLIVTMVWGLSTFGYLYFVFKGEAPATLKHIPFLATGTTTAAAAVCIIFFKILPFLILFLLAVVILDSIITWRKKWGRAQILPPGTWRKPR